MNAVRTRFNAVCVLLLMTPAWATAHQMPGSSLLLDVQDDSVSGQVAIPLSELGLALDMDLEHESITALQARDQQLQNYLNEHIKAHSGELPWLVRIATPGFSDAVQTDLGAYRELLANFVMTPPDGANTQAFTLDYDAVIHRLVTHSALVSVRRSNSVQGANDIVELGSISYDSVTSRIAPFVIDLTRIDEQRGFMDMLRLGMRHIREGTDHLLFLLTLLLPMPLLAHGRQWRGRQTVAESIRSILKITAAFTAGHSLTLILAAITHWSMAPRLIEALIAVSIIVGALHALRPLFPGRELLIAAAFGLIHGLAFSFTLTKLNLDPQHLITSLLGFNLGIELMQLIIVALIMPSLLLIATRWYGVFRIGGATLTLVAALGWLVERLGYANVIADTANTVATDGLWIIVVPAICAALAQLQQRTNALRPQPNNVSR